MAGEFGVDFGTGRTLYVNLRNRTSGFIWNGSDFEAYSSLSGSVFSYKIDLTEQGTASQHYVGNMPSTVPAGVYDVTCKQRLGLPYLETDPNIAVGEVNWNGTTVVPLSNLATSGQVAQVGPIRIYRGQMLENFHVYLVSSADHVTPLTSGVCSGQIAKDNGSYGAMASGIFTEVGHGSYRVTFTSGDLLCNTASFRVTANGISGGVSDPRVFSLVLQRTSGQN